MEIMSCNGKFDNNFADSKLGQSYLIAIELANCDNAKCGSSNRAGKINFITSPQCAGCASFILRNSSLILKNVCSILISKTQYHYDPKDQLTVPRSDCVVSSNKFELIEMSDSEILILNEHINIQYSSGGYPLAINPSHKCIASGIIQNSGAIIRSMRSTCGWHSVVLINVNNVFKVSKTDSRNLINFSLLLVICTLPDFCTEVGMCVEDNFNIQQCISKSKAAVVNVIEESIELKNAKFGSIFNISVKHPSADDLIPVLVDLLDSGAKKRVFSYSEKNTLSTIESTSLKLSSPNSEYKFVIELADDNEGLVESIDCEIDLGSSSNLESGCNIYLPCIRTVLMSNMCLIKIIGFLLERHNDSIQVTLDLHIICPKLCIIFGKVWANISATGSSVLIAIFFMQGIKNKTNFLRLDGLKQMYNKKRQQV
ncbi:hypothetical protein AGLY_004349 [Aphis glycines]|uniref:Uncharacterized protein n=1 Tax=Aphis glycines TaxID=307491 RepID=A0A6G0TYB7_APHGL|nr:hypothetical protein AGLY_004349 [Aphis glycines]